uniref:Alpha/beta hydrolase fold-3 domain-containing protein n=1 Tax=Oryza barthii TaxID=65489 RepID=A0A0D3HJZ2_9ORYZ
MSSDTTPTPTPTPPGQRAKPKPPMSRLMRLSLRAVDWATDATRRADGTLNRLALSVLDPRVPAFSSPCRGVASRDVVLHPPTRLRARLFYPSAAAGGKDERSPPPQPLPVIVFFHGGGFAFLSAASAAYDAACRRIARYASAAVLSVDYRRAPEHRCPAAYDDGIAALRYLDDPKNHGGGAGAAANFAAPSAAPGVDSPAFPPVLLAIGGYDPLQDWQRRYAEMLRGKGKDVRVFEYPNAIHAFYVFPAFDDGRDLMIRIAEFVAESAAGSGGSE